MSISLTLLVLLAALVHASWNAILKSQNDPLLSAAQMCFVWLIMAVVILPFLPLPSQESMPYLAASVVIHVAYFLFLAKSYEASDLSTAYPIIRGLPPVLVGISASLFISEPLSLSGWMGVLTISAGIISLNYGNYARISSKALTFSVLTAIMIATYTLVDGIGARASGHSTSFLLWFTLFQSIIYLAFVLHTRGKQQVASYFTANWTSGLVGGVISMLGYAVILWVVTKAPITYVSALRETSVLFASIIGMTFLKEPFAKSKLLSALLILIGIVLLKIT